MGTPAFSNAYVEFDDEQNLMAAFHAFKQWSKDANDGKKDGDFDINSPQINTEDDEKVLTYTVSSGRGQNCIWQCEQIRDFLKTQKGIQFISQDVMTCDASINWYTNEDEETNPEVIAGIKALPEFSK